MKKSTNALPSLQIPVKGMKSIATLPSSTEVSRLVAKVLSKSSAACTARYPIALVVADDRLQAIGLLTEAPVEASVGVASRASELKGCGEEETSQRDEEQETDSDVKTQVEQPPAGPTTIQDKYKLPPMEWKARAFAAAAVNLDEARPAEGNGPKVSISKLSRGDYNERVASVLQRVETLSGVLASMRGSFQLFSSDVQQHMKLLSEQLEELSGRRVTRGETAQGSRIG
jgi:hypothetical protein